MISNKLIFGIVVGFAGVMASLVSTSVPADDADAQSSAIEEIVVTARKRQESFVDVPTSLTVVSAEQLEAYDTQQLTELAHMVPNLYMDQTNSGKLMSIRGFGNVSINSHFDQAVGFARGTLQGEPVGTDIRHTGRQACTAVPGL